MPSTLASRRWKKSIFLSLKIVMASLKQKVVKGAIWTLLEQWSRQGVQFVVGMVLARLLTPSDYGTVALTAIFFAVANVLVDAGFGCALIQKKDADDLDFNSVFYLNVALAVGVYVILFFAAPSIADFYKTPVLIPIVRVSALSLFFNAVNAIQGAEMTKKMLFHLSFRISLITSFTSAVCGISLAFLGYGVWALVWSSLITGAVGTVSRWFIIAWRPRLLFSVHRLKPLFSFGWKMSLVSLIDQVFVNLNGLLIGRFYTKADLAFVNKGNNLPQMLMGNVDGTIGRVSFPALVEFQNDKKKLRDAMRRMMVCSTYLVFPLMVGLAGCSSSLIRLLYGDQWIPAVPYQMLACFSFALWPFHTINLRGIMVTGRSDIFLKLEIIKKTLRLVFILCFFRFGVFAFMAACAFALGPLSVLINAWPNQKLLDYPLRMQIMDVMPTVLVCLAEATVVFGLDFLFVNTSYLGLPIYIGLAVLLFAQFACGSIVFVVLSYLFRLKPLAEYFKILSPRLARRFPSLQRQIRNRLEI